MSDASLRRDERQTDDPGAEVRLLARRLRSGELELRQVELAAWVGHAPSARVLDVPDRPPLAVPEVLIALERWGHPTLVRGLLAIGLTAAPHLPPEQRDAAEALCAHVGVWLDDGGNDATRDAILRSAERLRRRDAAPRAMDAVVRVASELNPNGLAQEALQPEHVRARVWRAMENQAPASPQDAAVMAVGLTAWITAQALPPPDRQLSLRRFVGWIRRAGVTDADMRASLCEALAGWALGRGATR